MQNKINNLNYVITGYATAMNLPIIPLIKWLIANIFQYVIVT